MDIPADAKSFSAYLLLHDKLRRLDPDKNWKLNNNRYFRFRKRFLNDQKDEHGRLTCSYCNRNDLVIGSTGQNSNKNNRIPNLATIDHIYPLSLGGARFDVNNCAVSCKTCNGKKGSDVLL